MSKGENERLNYRKYRGLLRFYGQTTGGKLRTFFHRYDRRNQRRILRQSFQRGNPFRLGTSLNERMAQYE